MNNIFNNIFNIFNKRLLREQYKLNLETPEWNQVTFGEKSLKVYKPKVWNSLPFHIKTSENLIQFKSLIKNWNRLVAQFAQSMLFISFIFLLRIL